MLEIKPATKATIIFDPSNIDLFELCEARYNYRVNLRRSLPVIQKNRSLDKGTLAHTGFETYYKLLADGGTGFANRIDAMTLKMRVAASDPDISNMDVSEAEELISVVQENLDFWRHEDEMLTIHQVEQVFAYVIYEDEDVRIIMSGKIDLLVDKPAVSGSSGYTNLPIDHKTYSRDSGVLRLSNQFQCYAKTVESNYLIVNRVGLQKTLKPEEKYKRLPLSYDPMILEQWKDNLVKIVLEKYLNCVAMNSWPMNFTSCLKFNRLCEYYEVCDSSGEAAKKFKLESNYIDADPWDVTKEIE